MSLIKSISMESRYNGGKAGDGLNPLDIVKFTAAYATFIRKNTPDKNEQKLLSDMMPASLARW